VSGSILKAACVQLCGTRSVRHNVSDALGLIGQAADEGARFIVTPEQTALMELDSTPLFNGIDVEEETSCLEDFSKIAAQKKIWLQIGSLAVKVSEDKAVNRSYLFSPEGEITARYDKLHMFDVDLPGGETYRESKTYSAGESAVVADIGKTKLGFSICYDLRFPVLYRDLSKAGAGIISVPAAFTKQTGEAHWHILLRARAIETGCFILAAAQGGTHENGRETYGHSLIISPWGDILAEAGTEPGFISADLDLSMIENVRNRIPTRSHDRLYEMKSDV